MDAYQKYVPEKYAAPAAKGNPVDDYVGYYKIIGEGKPVNWDAKTGTDKWFEDDWYMMEHLGFYKNVYLNPTNNDGVQHERKDFRKVPTREVFGKYLTYLQLGSPTSKKNYREANPELDEWGVLAEIWSKPISEQKRRTELSATDRALEDVNTQRLTWQQQIDEIYGILAGVK